MLRSNTPHAGWRIAHLMMAAFSMLVGFSANDSARSETARIVAFGASNFNGRGVSPQQAMPAQLEAMLRAKGIDATITLITQDGITSTELLGRVGSVPSGAKVVLIEQLKGNDARRGVSPAQNAANIAKVGSLLSARGMKTIKVKFSDGGRQADGIHLTAAAHRAAAASHLNQVIAALKAK